MTPGRRPFLVALISSLLSSLIAACTPNRRSLPQPIDAADLPPAIPSAPPLSPTPTLSPTATVTPSSTPTSTPTITQTFTPRPTATITHTPTITNTPRPTDTPSATLPPTAIPPSITLSPTLTLVPIPDTIVPRAEWGAVPPSGPGLPNIPSRLTIHHDGQPFQPTDDPLQRLQTTQRYSMQTQGWIDMPYHFILDPAGTIYEGRDIYTQVDTGTRYDTAGHVGITLIGDYNTQSPTSPMIDSLARLLAWLSSSYAIPLDTLKGHRDVAVTSCPGGLFYDAYLANGLLRVQAAAYLP